jgi:uncharacterized protein YndB with AHSA1/START domain
MESRLMLVGINRFFKAPRDRVFAAFTETDLFQQWWGPKTFSCPVAELDPRPGGVFHAEMLSSEGNTHVIDGIFREVSPPSRLVFTWAWQQGDYMNLENLVTLEFIAVEGGTELRLTHETLADEHAREQHSQGWSSSFDCLEEQLEKGNNP